MRGAARRHPGEPAAGLRDPPVSPDPPRGHGEPMDTTAASGGTDARAGLPPAARRWLDRAVRPGRAGFVEMFDPADPARDPGSLRTTLVTARLTYVFSHAHLLDPQSEALAAARHGFAFLRDACREGGQGG